MYLVLIETSGNQSFIFATNKLKENIGASELTYRVSTQWLLKIIGDISENQSLKVWQDNDRLRQLLLDSSKNPPINETSSNNAVEIIIAVSGKALLITKIEDVAKNIITKITTKALIEAPGIDISGVYQEFEWETQIEDAVKQVYKKHQTNHSRLPSPDFRFLRLPIIAPCITSGLPASQLKTSNDNQEVISQISAVKRENTDNFLNRIERLVENEKLKFPNSTNELEKKFDNLDWLAIVHADGNGLGQIFLNFENFINQELTGIEDKNRDYINQLRKFSLALDLCTENAFKKSIKVFEETKTVIKRNQVQKILPIVPLVLGGDDLTVICDGKKAIEFTKEFLLAFEAETAREDLPDTLNDIIPSLAKDEKGLNSSNLSACAGIAIIKPHFPFSVGYHLAESLIKSAKTVKNNVKQRVKGEDKKTASCSALDFHIVYDSSGIDLDLIRNRLEIEKTEDSNTLLYKRPLVVTKVNEKNRLTNITDDSEKWVKFYHWDNFKTKVELLAQAKEEFNHNIDDKNQSDNDKEKKKPPLPPNQSNKIRSSLYQGMTAGNAQYNLIRNRYHTKELEESKNSLFTTIPTVENDNSEDDRQQKQTYITGFLDALQAVGFM